MPVAPETRFRIGTASTVLTSAAVGLLLEKDRLKLDEKIQTYVPEFPEHGIVVSVTSNISYADTFAVALKIAQTFATDKAITAGR